MNVLFLGGMSERNKPWIFEVERTLAPLFNKTLVHEYSHWSDPNKIANLNEELAAAAEKTKSLGEYIIFAKSFGSLLSLQGMYEGVLTPTKCIFAGLPLKLALGEGMDLRSLLVARKTPILLIQNSHDPVGSYQKLKTLTQNTSIQLIELPGDTHNYDDLQKIEELTSGFITS